VSIPTGWRKAFGLYSATCAGIGRNRISVLSVSSVADFSEAFFYRVVPGIFAARFFSGTNNVH
jgi:hypothetical protein